MKIGDKVKPIRSNHIGTVSIVKRTLPMAMSFIVDDAGEEKAIYQDYCECEAEDGTIFFSWEDDLELIE